MPKLIVQIPCFNEEETLARTIADVPREIEGLSKVEILVIDDGSTDRTAEIAQEAGADFLIQNGSNIGLAQSFQRGLDACLARGADIIVNTDGDNQYNGADIPALVQPILEGRADIVVGDRQTDQINHFGPLKRFLQKAGSQMVSGLADAEIHDAVSGFRAFSRRAAMGVTVRSTFSYTTETLIQAGRKRLRIASTPVRTNEVTRPSRLFRSIPHFLMRTGRTMLRVFAMYEPLKIFTALGALLMLAGAAPIARFLFHYMSGDGAGMIQSLILGGVLFLAGGFCVMFALIADLIAYNRQLLELTLERVRKIEYAMNEERSQVLGRRRFPTKKLRDELDTIAARLR
ncbi:MAG: glycosyltransferase family 2 protein [Pseudomonadota bacterium]